MALMTVPHPGYPFKTSRASATTERTHARKRKSDFNPDSDSQAPEGTVKERLEKETFRYCLKKRDKENTATVTLFYIPDQIRDCVPFIAEVVNTRIHVGVQAIYCCALEKGVETLAEHPELEGYSSMKTRSVSGEHKGSRHETIIRKYIYVPTFEAPREVSKTIIPVYLDLKKSISRFAGAYNVSESTTAYLCVLEGLSDEPTVAEGTRKWMKEQLEMFWENVHLKTATISLRIDTIEKWEKGGKKPWETDLSLP